MDRLVILDHEHWLSLQDRIREDYGESVLLISWRCQKVLGFAVRYHEFLKDIPDSKYKTWQKQVHLDFVDADRKTFFCMKYL